MASMEWRTCEHCAWKVRRFEQALVPLRRLRHGKSDNLMSFGYRKTFGSVMENFELHGSDHAFLEISWLPGIPEYIWLAMSVENWMPLFKKIDSAISDYKKVFTNDGDRYSQQKSTSIECVHSPGMWFRLMEWTTTFWLSCGTSTLVPSPVYLWKQGWKAGRQMLRST